MIEEQRKKVALIRSLQAGKAFESESKEVKEQPSKFKKNSRSRSESS
jgi:hypothetical protein